MAGATQVDEFGDRWLHVDKETTGEDLAHLPERLRRDVESLAAGVRERVPDDVDWSLSFDNRGTRFATEYEDGMAGTVNGGRYYGKRSKLFADLECADWDEFRKDSLQGMDIFDALVSDAAERPVNIPSSREAAEKYTQELDAILSKRMGVVAPPFVLVTARDDEDVRDCEHKTREEVIGDIADAMTTAYDILAVVENGEKWTFDAIESAKLEAVEGLGPISRAKAEGRFGL